MQSDTTNKMVALKDIHGSTRIIYLSEIMKFVTSSIESSKDVYDMSVAMRLDSIRTDSTPEHLKKFITVSLTNLENSKIKGKSIDFERSTFSSTAYDNIKSYSEYHDNIEDDNNGKCPVTCDFDVHRLTVYVYICGWILRRKTMWGYNKEENFRYIFTQDSMLRVRDSSNMTSLKSAVEQLTVCDQ